MAPVEKKTTGNAHPKKQERGKMKMCQLTLCFPSFLDSESNTQILGTGLFAKILKRVHFPLPYIFLDFDHLINVY